MINYKLLPESLRSGVKAYIEEGRRPGGFLTAVITNDLFGALSRADSGNAVALRDIATFFYNEVPAGCYGSKEAMDEWITQKHQELADAKKKPLDNTY